MVPLSERKNNYDLGCRCVNDRGGSRRGASSLELAHSSTLITSIFPNFLLCADAADAAAKNNKNERLSLASLGSISGLVLHPILSLDSIF
jgi:hypothetical protein